MTPKAMSRYGPVNTEVALGTATMVSNTAHFNAHRHVGAKTFEQASKVGDFNGG